MRHPVVRRVEVRPGLELNVVGWERGSVGGTGLPFVLVHGLSSNARLWDGVGSELARLGHAVVAVDLRGHGHSDKPEEGYDVSTVADDLARLIEVLGGERPVVVGQSWGGNVVVELAATRGELISGVGCVDGGMIDLRGPFPDWDDAARELAPPPLAGRSIGEVESMLRAVHPDWPESGIQGTLECFRLLPDDTVEPRLTFDRHMDALRGLWEHDVFSRLPRIEAPVLFVPADGGDQGWVEDKRSSVDRAAKSASTARVQWMKGDHDLHAQHPVELAALLHEAALDLWR